MFKSIVVAIDGSKHSHKALDYAKDLAEQSKAALWLVHVFPHTSGLLEGDVYEKLVVKRESEGQAILDEARQKLGDTTLEVHEELLEAPETEAIISVAKTRKADLIVMGSRGRGSLQGLLLGSITHKVIQHAPCPVMVVR